MIYYNETFATLAEAEAFVERTYAAFHPMGYGTSLRILPTQDGTYLVTGSRGRSCD